MWNDILIIIDRVNLYLQNKKVTIDAANRILNGLMLAVKEYRNEMLDDIFAKAKVTLDKIGIKSDFSMKRKHKVRRLFDEKDEDETHLATSKDIFIKECYMVIDTILSQINWRYESFRDVCSDFTFLTGQSLALMSTEEFKKKNATNLAAKYCKDLDRSLLI